MSTNWRNVWTQRIQLAPSLERWQDFPTFFSLNLDSAKQYCYNTINVVCNRSKGDHFHWTKWAQSLFFQSQSETKTYERKTPYAASKVKGYLLCLWSQNSHDSALKDSRRTIFPTQSFPFVVRSKRALETKHGANPLVPLVSYCFISGVFFFFAFLFFSRPDTCTRK